MNEEMDAKQLEHFIGQVVNGEFGTYKKEAAALGPDEFAKKYGHKVWLWGATRPVYKCVRHEGTDYLWSLRTGKFDGWDGINLPPRESREQKD